MQERAVKAKGSEPSPESGAVNRIVRFIDVQFKEVERTGSSRSSGKCNS